MDGERERNLGAGREGREVLDRVLPLLRRLHSVGCERDKAGKPRSAHGSVLCPDLFVLFSPVVDSLRGIQRVSELRKVQRLLGCGRASLGSLSESVRRIRPRLRARPDGRVGGGVDAARPRIRGWQSCKQTITLVDGTLLPP